MSCDIWALTWPFLSSSSSCLIRDLDHAFIFRNLASDLLASSVFNLACAVEDRCEHMSVLGGGVQVASELPGNMFTLG